MNYLDPNSENKLLFIYFYSFASQVNLSFIRDVLICTLKQNKNTE